MTYRTLKYFNAGLGGRRDHGLTEVIDGDGSLDKYSRKKQPLT